MQALGDSVPRVAFAIPFGQDERSFPVEDLGTTFFPPFQSNQSGTKAYMGLPRLVKILSHTLCIWLLSEI